MSPVLFWDSQADLLASPGRMRRACFRANGNPLK
jgi:hypothetical protein